MRDGSAYGERRAWTAQANYGSSVEQPVAGFYKVKLRGGSVRCGVRLVFGAPLDPVTGEELDRSWRWMAFLDDGTLAEFDDVWPNCAGDPISEDDYRAYCARRTWAEQNAPNSSFAKPRKRYDPLSSSEPLPF